MLSAVHPGPQYGAATQAKNVVCAPSQIRRRGRKTAISRGILPAARQARNNAPGSAMELEAAQSALRQRV